MTNDPGDGLRGLSSHLGTHVRPGDRVDGGSIPMTIRTKYNIYANPVLEDTDIRKCIDSGLLIHIPVERDGVVP